MTNNNRVLTITKLSLVDGIRVKNEVSNDLACRPHTPQKSQRTLLTHCVCIRACVYVYMCICMLCKSNVRMCARLSVCTCSYACTHVWRCIDAGMQACVSPHVVFTICGTYSCAKVSVQRAFVSRLSM